MFSLILLTFISVPNTPSDSYSITLPHYLPYFDIIFQFIAWSAATFLLLSFLWCSCVRFCASLGRGRGTPGHLGQRCVRINIPSIVVVLIGFAVNKSRFINIVLDPSALGMPYGLAGVPGPLLLLLRLRAHVARRQSDLQADSTRLDSRLHPQSVSAPQLIVVGSIHSL